MLTAILCTIGTALVRAVVRKTGQLASLNLSELQRKRKLEFAYLFAYSPNLLAFSLKFSLVCRKLVATLKNKQKAPLKREVLLCLEFELLFSYFCDLRQLASFFGTELELSLIHI